MTLRDMSAVHHSLIVKCKSRQKYQKCLKSFKTAPNQRILQLHNLQLALTTLGIACLLVVFVYKRVPVNLLVEYSNIKLLG